MTEKSRDQKRKGIKGIEIKRIEDWLRNEER